MTWQWMTYDRMYVPNWMAYSFVKHLLKLTLPTLKETHLGTQFSYVKSNFRSNKNGMCSMHPVQVGGVYQVLVCQTHWLMLAGISLNFHPLSRSHFLRSSEIIYTYIRLLLSGYYAKWLCQLTPPTLRGEISGYSPAM